ARAAEEAGFASAQPPRQRNRDFGPSSWRHEVAHDLGSRSGRGRGQVIADSVLRYWMPLASGRIAVRYRFVELDRAHRLVDDVAAKLARYAQLREVWSERRVASRDAASGA